MELIKEKEQYIQVLAKNNEKISVEGDIIVPDVKPDVLKVLQVDAVSHIKDKGITSGGVYVEGVLNVNILYIPDSDEETTGCIKASFEFRDRFDCADISNNMKLKMHCDVSRIEFTLLNSRKLAIKALVGVCYEILGERELEIPCGFDGESGECLKTSYSLNKIAVDEESEFIVRDSMEIPAGKQSVNEILKTDAKITQRDIKAVSQKLIAKGVLEICVLYRANDGGVDFCVGEFPFTEVFDAYNLEETDNCSLELDIGEIFTETAEDSDGDIRIINFECSVNAGLRGERTTDVKVISDCYFPGMNTQITYKKENICCIAGTISEQKSIKEIIAPDSKLPQLVKIYNVIGETEITKTQTLDGQVAVEGKLRVYILYLTDNKKCAVYTFKKDIPLSYTFSCENARPGMQAEAKVIVDHISYNINSMGEIELRAILGFDIKVCEEKCVELMCDVTAEERTESKDIIIYFVKNNDTIWDIAKKYAVRCSDIITVNSLDDTTLHQGQKLLIPTGVY